MKRQRGVALVTALLILALAAVLAAALSYDATLATRRAGNMIWRDSAMAFLLGAETWAADTLDADDAEVDHLQELWAQELPPLPIEGGFLSGRLQDLQGRFNLNNLVQADEAEAEIALAQFQRLLQLLELPPGLAQATADWLDADQELRFPDGAEDADYQRLTPAYQAADRPLLTISELLAVQGMTVEHYLTLAPHVAALPPGTALNVNTATGPVLQSLVPGATRGTVEGLIRDRGRDPFRELAPVVEALGGEVDVPLSLNSSYFQLEAQAVVGNLPVTLYSLLSRAQGITRPLLRSLDAE